MRATIREMVRVLTQPPGFVDVAVDELGARQTLRAQVARLERELQQTLVTSFPRTGIDASLPAARRAASPRILSLGELERLRDRLSAKLTETRRALDVRTEQEEESRRLLERMLLAPGKHKFVRVRNADLGEGGCGVWHVRPRLGLVGMLMGWWHVKLSSGCPLAEGRRPPLRVVPQPA